MQTIFMGGIKNLLQSSKSSENTTERIMKNLSKSSYGLNRENTVSDTASSIMDAFEVTKNISELLSPACGMTDEEKEAYFQRIIAKLKSGQKLSAEEMRFLQAEHPELYQQAARVQAMRDGLETRLKTATSKQRAQEIFADSLSHVSDKDPMKEYLVASYMDAMKNFEKSDAYKDLPDTEEEARREKDKKKIHMDIKVEYEDTEKAS